MPKIDIASVPEIRRCGYPSPLDQNCLDRVRKALGDAGGLSQFGVNLLTLSPGTWSAQRHWHDVEDEFVFVLSGEVTLVTDKGEEILRAGECAAFPKSVPDGHHLINKSNAPATALEIGTRTPKDGDMCYYPDQDLVWNGPKGVYTHRDGTPYPPKKDNG